MSALPRITVVTPSFQMGRVLETTVRSVVEQDYPHLEYIVMDGGSTDGSVEILERYADRITHWQSEADEGQTHAIQAGFERATGDVLCWVNADDLLLPGSLAAVGAWFAADPARRFLVSHALRLDPLGRPIRRWYAAPPTYRAVLFGGTNPGFAQPAAFWTRAAYDAAGGIDPSFTSIMDVEWYLRLLQGGPAGLLDAFTAAFREHGDQKSGVLHAATAAELERVRAQHGYGKASALWRRVLRKHYGRRRRRYARRGKRTTRSADPEAALASFLSA
ncbi:MAG: glycosyltransferase family 2 protein [Planctomycetota bacterium]|nr:glycosyltransferase family 2 protein [Planctomycetota bacterium]